MRTLLAFFLLPIFCFAVEIHDLSLEQKIGQLFVTCFHGEELDSPTKIFFNQTHIGNVVLYNWANGLHSKNQIRTLTRQLNSHLTSINGVPPLIAIDQEGGRVNRLQYIQKFPSAAAIQDPNSAYLTGKKMGQILASLGINLNFAPVVDINSNPNNHVIGDRSFSSDPGQVTLLARNMMQGMHEESVFTTLKHFPGHGDTNSDSHFTLPVIHKNREDLEKTEWFPFKKLCQETDCIMTAHLLIPSLSKKPATFSPLLLQTILRETWGFEGVIITDSLTMGAITQNASTLDEAAALIAEAAIKAFLAGCDLLLIGRVEQENLPFPPEEDHLLIEKVVASFTNSVKKGMISEQRIDESLERIFVLKK